MNFKDKLNFSKTVNEFGIYYHFETVFYNGSVSLLFEILHEGGG